MLVVVAMFLIFVLLIGVVVGVIVGVVVVVVNKAKFMLLCWWCYWCKCSCSNGVDVGCDVAYEVLR